MSLLSGIVTLPWFYAIQAYQQAFYEYPLKEESEAGAKRIPKNDPRYQEVISRLSGHKIKANMQDFLDRNGIRKDIIFFKSYAWKGIMPYGTNFFQTGDAALFIHPELYKIDQPACHWGIKYAIYQIKNNDTFLHPFVPGICRLAAAIFGMCFLSFIPAVVLAATVSVVAGALFSQWRKAKADDFAIENSSDEELKGGRRFLIAQKLRNTALRDSIKVFKIFISESGNVRLNFFAPSLTSRIEKIESALHDRGVEIDEEQEGSGVSKIREWLEASLTK